jgi:hypothetical protein
MELDQKSLEAYWENRSGTLKSLLFKMQSREDWTFDHNGSHDGLMDILGKALEDPECLKRAKANTPATLEFIAWLSSPRALLMLDKVDAANTGLAAEMVMDAEGLSENPVYRTFIESLDVVTRTHLLSKVFSPDRMALVDCAVKVAREESQ